MMPLVIAGPTASGKSSLAFRLARIYGGEIICADSRQFYRGMDIGTACPSLDEQIVVPHHGYGQLDPKVQRMDAGSFVAFANQKIQEIVARGKRPILVGGTGLYLRALYFGMGNVPKSDKNISQEIVKNSEQLGLNLYDELQKIDPLSAKRIRPEDRYRIVRALEIFSLTKMPPSQLRQSFTDGRAKLRAHFIYKRPPKILLQKYIEERVHDMFAKGLLDEAKTLRENLPAGHWAFSVTGYQEAFGILDHELTVGQAIDKIAQRHRQYAKRQYTWFNKERFYRFIIQS